MNSVECAIRKGTRNNSCASTPYLDRCDSSGFTKESSSRRESVATVALSSSSAYKHNCAQVPPCTGTSEGEESVLERRRLAGQLRVRLPLTLGLEVTLEPGARWGPGIPVCSSPQSRLNQTRSCNVSNACKPAADSSSPLRAKPPASLSWNVPVPTRERRIRCSSGRVGGCVRSARAGGSARLVASAASSRSIALRNSSTMACCRSAIDFSLRSASRRSEAASNSSRSIARCTVSVLLVHSRTYTSYADLHRHAQLSQEAAPRPQGTRTRALGKQIQHKHLTSSVAHGIYLRALAILRAWYECTRLCMHVQQVDWVYTRAYACMHGRVNEFADAPGAYVQ
jgi:hypothetical protein